MLLSSLRQRKSLTWKDFQAHAPSITFMMLANLVPVAGVIWYDWSVFALLVLFWIENVIIGFFNVPRIIMAKGHEHPGVEVGGDKITKGIIWFIAIFFIIHYGGFAFGHGFFVFGMLGEKRDDGSQYELLDALDVIGEYGLTIAVIALIISHGFSFGYNYLYKGRYKQSIFILQMFTPYRRVILLHITIIIGGALMTALGEPLIGLVVLIALKIYMDVKAHVYEYADSIDPYNLNAAWINALQKKAPKN